MKVTSRYQEPFTIKQKMLKDIGPLLQKTEQVQKVKFGMRSRSINVRRLPVERQFALPFEGHGNDPEVRQSKYKFHKIQSATITSSTIGPGERTPEPTTLALKIGKSLSSSRPPLELTAERTLVSSESYLPLPPTGG